MPVNVTSTGEFDLELFSHQTSIPLDTLNRLLDDLAGLTGTWHVTVHDPDEHDPHGRLTIQHSCFNEHTSIEVSSRYTGRKFTYEVHYPMDADILTYETEDDSVEDAIRTAVELANRERRRQSRFLPTFDFSNPLPSLHSRT